MPRKKNSRADALADAFAVFNLDATVVPEEAVQQQIEYEALEDNRVLEAESVVFYIETKGDAAVWRKRTCTQCGAKFLSSYTHVSLCTNECRKEYFASKGMFWDPTGKTEAERWGGQIPMVIGPEATKALQKIEFPKDEPAIPSARSNENPTPVGLESGIDDDVDTFLSELD